MTVSEMKRDAVRRISLLGDSDAKTMRSIWLYVSSALPTRQEKPEDDERAMAKELAHSFLGAFSASRTEKDWKDVKEEYLTSKYADQ